MSYTITYIDADGQDRMDGRQFGSEKRAQAIADEYNASHRSSRAKVVRMRTS